MADSYKLLGYPTALPNTLSSGDAMLPSPNNPNTRIQSHNRPDSPESVAKTRRAMDSSYPTPYQDVTTHLKIKRRAVSSPISDDPDDVLWKIFWWAMYETMVDYRRMLTPPPSTIDYGDSLDPLGERWVISQVSRRWDAVFPALWQNAAQRQTVILRKTMESCMILLHPLSITFVSVPSHRELPLHSMTRSLVHLYLFNLSHDTIPRIEYGHLQLPMLESLWLCETELIVSRPVDDPFFPDITYHPLAKSPIGVLMESTSTPLLQLLHLSFGTPSNVNMPLLPESLDDSRSTDSLRFRECIVFWGKLGQRMSWI